MVNRIIGVRREAMAKVLATFVLAAGLLAAGTSTAYARGGADDGPRHEQHRHHHHHHHHHAGEDGRNHR